MGKTRTILFVEDNARIREVLPEILPEDEFRSLVAADAKEALRILCDQHVDLLLTDIVMPGLDGIELALKVKRVWPDILVILMTGYSSRAKEAESIGPLLIKPTRAIEIETVIRRTLDPSFRIH